MPNTKITAVLTLAGLAAAASGQVSFTLIGNDILPFNPQTGFPDPAGTGYVATGLTPDGATVVGVAGDNVWSWDASMGGLPVFISTDGGGLAAISADGTKIAADHTYPEATFPPGWFAIPPVTTNGLIEAPSTYDVATGVWTPLPPVSVDDGMGGLVTNAIELDNSAGSAFNMSADGSTIVGFAWIDVGGTANAFTSDGVTTTQLFDDMETSSRATCVSADGSVVGGTIGGGRRPAVWVNGTLVELSQSGGEVNAISSDGTYVTGNIGRELMLWTANGQGGYTARSLGSIADPNDPFMRPTPTGLGVSDDGLFICGIELYFGGAGVGLIWTPATGLIPANDYFDLIGITRPQVTASSGFEEEFSLSNMTGVNPEGTRVIGWGNADGDPLFLYRRAFLAQIERPCGFGDLAMPWQVLNTDDNIEMINALENDEARADIDGDGERDFLDVIAHLRAYDAGCP